MSENSFCNQHSGHVENIRELREFKKSTVASRLETINRIWEEMEKKVSKGLFVSSCIIIVGLMGTLFGLVYHSNNQVLHELVKIKIDIALIAKTLK